MKAASKRSAKGTQLPARRVATPRYFATSADFRGWLTLHHATDSELLVGFYKTKSGKPSITWPESVDQASIWSTINVAKVEALRAAGKMMPAGEAAFALRRTA